MCGEMPHGLKVVTCCYCGARSTLRAEGGQRLVCHGCGAPLSRVEALSPKASPKRKPHPGADSGPKPATPHPAERRREHHWKDRPARRKKGKRRKGGLLHRLGKAFDDLEDIFDLFD